MNDVLKLFAVFSLLFGEECCDVVLAKYFSVLGLLSGTFFAFTLLQPLFGKLCINACTVNQGNG